MENKMENELKKCKESIVYWVENYVMIPNGNEAVKYVETEFYKSSNKYKQFFESYDNGVNDLNLLGSRQCGKSTVLAIIEAYMVTFNKGKINNVDINKINNTNNNNILKFIIKNLPEWQNCKIDSNRSVNNKIIFTNGSSIETIIPTDKLDMGKVKETFKLSNMIKFDEFAFLNGSEEFYEIYKDTLKDRQKLDYNVTLFASTINRSNKLYSKICMDANNIPITSIIKWQDIYDDEWYNQQCMNLNFNKDRIETELDCKF